MNQNIGQTLIDLRGDRPRKEVAAELGISCSALQMYENGRRVPLDEIKVRIARFYGKSVEEIFYANEEHEKCG